jgi:hypothetical protein
MADARRPARLRQKPSPIPPLSGREPDHRGEGQRRSAGQLLVRFPGRNCGAPGIAAGMRVASAFQYSSVGNSLLVVDAAVQGDVDAEDQ